MGWFASGTGAAGLVGAAAWWIVRPLGVQLGLGILSLLPGLMVGAYVLILPTVEKLLGQTGRGAYEAVPTIDQTPSHQDGRPKDDDEDDEESDAESIMELAASPIALASSESPGHHAQIRLSFQDKMTLLKPMLWPYIFPLVTVYFAEYTINQGVVSSFMSLVPPFRSLSLTSVYKGSNAGLSSAHTQAAPASISYHPQAIRLLPSLPARLPGKLLTALQLPWS